MKFKESMLSRLISVTDILNEPIPGVPLVELLGRDRVLVENHGGVIQYCPNEVVIKLAYGPVAIYGYNLHLPVMTKYQLVVAGRIQCIKLGSERI